MTQAPETEVTEPGSTPQEKRSSISDTFKSGWNMVKKETSKLKEKAKERMKMEGLLKQARESLQKFLDPDLDIEKQIPIKLLRKAKGIVFLTVLKAGFGFGGEAGTGLLIIKDPNNSKDWSQPIAIGAAGIKWGLQIGASKVDYIMVLTTDDAVKTFTTDGQLKLGGDLNISVGPKGRDCDMGVIASENSATAIYSYAMAKGAYIGITLKGEGIAIRGDCNQAFYGKKTKPDEIINRKVVMKSNNDYNAICSILDAYTEQKKEDKKNDDKDDKKNDDKEEDPVNKNEVNI